MNNRSRFVRRNALYPLAILAAAFPAMAAAQANEAAVSSASILDDITLTSTRDMDFGRIVAPSGGRVDMAATDAPVCTANNALQLLDTCQSAAFNGSGVAGTQIRVSVPPGRRINLTGPDRDLRVRRMTVGAGDGLAFVRRRNRNFEFTVTDANGAFEFFVGARLLIRNNQGPGIYTGTFDIEVDYQ
jgi:hypothetical protein